jgi:hypothetical protein
MMRILISFFLERDEVLKLHRYEKFNKSNKDYEKVLSKENRFSYLHDRWKRNESSERV